MKKLLITSLFLLFSFNSFSKVLVVSDLDDTIKIAGIGDKIEVMANYAFGVKPFPHLLNLYHDIKEHYNSEGEEVEFVYITSAPRFVNSRKWLENHNVPVGRLIQRNNRALINFFGESSKEYKIRSLTEVIQGNDYDEILLFGDNGENDPIIYNTVTTRLNLTDAKIYIRDITARALACGEGLRGINYFLTEGTLVVGDFSEIASQELKQEIHQGMVRGDILPDFVIERYLENKENNCR